jgi:Imidazolonepropionase and related amidohydrolases
MGTDTGPPARFQGYFELMELEMMAKAGLTPRQVLASATRDAARCMKLDAEVGTLEPNKWADFVALDGPTRRHHQRQKNRFSLDRRESRPALNKSVIG